MVAIWKREWKSYFQNVTGWLFISALLALFGLYFYNTNLRAGYPYLYYALSNVTILFLIAVPVLTMRSFAEEKKNKTDQLVLTAPVSVGSVVFGKYLALVSVFSVDVAIYALAPLVLSSFGVVPMGESYVALLGFWLFGCACIAVGMFLSSLTESQVIAAVLSVAVLFVCYMMQGITGLISADGNWLTLVLGCFDLYSPFAEFCAGSLKITGLVYYLSVILLMNFLTVQSIQKRRWSMSKKNFSTGVFSTTFIVVALVLTVVVNLAVNALPSTVTSIDCSYTKLYSITDQTKDYLKSLDEDVTIYVLAAENQKEAQIDEMLMRYDDLSKHIRVEYVNPSVKPDFYRQYTETAPNVNSLIVAGEKRSKVIDYYDLYVFDYDMYTYQSEVVGFDAEGQITSAIEYVTMDSSSLPVIYMIEGHEEQPLGSAFEELIAKANISLTSIDLFNEERVPEDAAAIIINSPQKDFNEADAKKVTDYLNAGGKAVITGIYGCSELVNFSSILKEYGLSFTDGIIAENDKEYYYNWGGPLYLLPVVKNTDYTKNIGGNRVYVPVSAGILHTDEEGVNCTVLMETTESSVAKNDPQNMQSFEHEEGDDEGPFSIGLAVTKEAETGMTELAVFGTPIIFSDDASRLTGNNGTLFTDLVSCMVGDVELASSVIPQKSYSLGTLTVNAFQALLLSVVVMFLVPAALLIIGIVIFAVRRKR